MSITIYAIDNQFAAATGSNVNSGPGTSTFDYPPTSTHSLIIESLPGDTSPYVFSPGDTYSLTFSGQGGDTISEATVVRSDYINIDGDEGYAVVFEGLDSNGELTQVVWTPEFDMETWYFNNFDEGNPPGFYNTDTSSTSTYQAVCFEESMRVDTPVGMRPVASLRPGDLVMTTEKGPQRVQWIASRRVRGWGRHAPVVFETGVLGNQTQLVLSQQHRILLSVPEKRERYGAPEVLVPAVAFVDGQGIRIRPRAWITYVHLLFERHELVNCEGVACESLFLGKMAARVLGALDAPGDHETTASEVETFLDLFAARVGQEPARPLLGVREGAALLSELTGRPPRPAAMLFGPGRKNARAYRLDPASGLAHHAGTGRPAFVALKETA